MPDVVDLYDAFEDPEFKATFLKLVNMVRAEIAVIRHLRETAAEPVRKPKETPPPAQPPVGSAPHGAAGTRPRNRNASRHRARRVPHRAPLRTRIVIIIDELD